MSTQDSAALAVLKTMRDEAIQLRNAHSSHGDCLTAYRAQERLDALTDAIVRVQGAEVREGSGR